MSGVSGLCVGEIMKSRLGPVQIVALEKTAVRVRVMAYGDVEIQIAYSDLIPVQATSGSACAPITPSTSTTKPRQVRRAAPSGIRAAVSPARRTLEALRFGLVPGAGLEQLTLGYDTVRTWIEGRLPKAHGGKPTISQITGKYGTGKSHTAAVVRHLAREHGYLTARVEVDGNSVTLFDPKTVLQSLWATLQGTDHESATPVLDLYVKAIEKGASTPRVAGSGLDRIGPNFTTIQTLLRRNALDTHAQEIDALLSCSEEHTAVEVKQMILAEQIVSTIDVDLKPTIGRDLATRSADFIHSLVGHATLARLAGYHGLIITIDEFEVELSVLTPQKLERVSSLIYALITYLNGKSSHPTAPLGIFIADVGHTRSVGDSILKAIMQATGGGLYALRPFTASDRRELARRIHAQYASVYTGVGSFDPSLVARVEQALGPHDSDSGQIRAFVKQYVAALDTRFGPGVTG